MNNGLILTIITIVGAAAFIFLALALNLPVYAVLVNTAILGAHMVIGGLLLIFNLVNKEEFDWGVARAIAHENWFWWIVMAAVAIAGIFSQLQIVNRIALPQNRWSKVEQI